MAHSEAEYIVAIFPNDFAEKKEPPENASRRFRISSTHSTLLERNKRKQRSPRQAKGVKEKAMNAIKST